MNFKEAKRSLHRMGWVVDRIRGSHYIFVKNGVEFILSQHTGDIKKFARDAVRRMEKQHEEEIKQAENTPHGKLLLKLQRHYGVRHVMLEGGYITNEEYHKEVIQVVEEVLGIKL